jgi:hypothetical protein
VKSRERHGCNRSESPGSLSNIPGNLQHCFGAVRIAGIAGAHANFEAAQEESRGAITRVRGSVGDVEFPAEKMPLINEALTVESKSHNLQMELNKRLRWAESVGS